MSTAAAPAQAADGSPIEDKPARKKHEQSALGGALSRTAALYFSPARTVRLFRPVKVSAFTAISELAGKTALSPSVIWSTIKQEGWRFGPRYVLPPLLFNTAAGFSLFFSYSIVDSSLRYVPNPLPNASYPFIAGACAGAAQAIVSAPLDNARLVIAERQKSSSTVPFRWSSVLKDALFPQWLTHAHLYESSSISSRLGRLRGLVRWAGRGWSLLMLTVVRDALGFGMFFLAFEQVRQVARQAGLGFDRQLKKLGALDQENDGRRWTGRTAQALVIVVGGTFSAIAYGLIGKPFDKMRGIIWHGRVHWAEELATKPAEPMRMPSTRWQKLSQRVVGPHHPSPSMPSAVSLVRSAVRKDGVAKTFGLSIPRLADLDEAAHHPTLEGGNSAQRSAMRTAGQLARRGGIRFLTLLSPYSVALLAYAALSDDFR